MPNLITGRRVGERIGIPIRPFLLSRSIVASFAWREVGYRQLQRGQMNKNKSKKMADPSDSMEELWSAKDLAEYFGVARCIVYGLGIPSIRVGKRRLRYRPEDVRAWVASRKTVDAQPDDGNGCDQHVQRPNGTDLSDPSPFGDDQFRLFMKGHQRQRCTSRGPSQDHGP